MPSYTQEHIIDAIQEAARNYAKGEPESGIRKLAIEMDMRPSSLGNALNPYADRSVVKLGLEQAMFIMQRTGNVKALEIMAYELGYTLQAANAVPDKDDIRDEMLDDSSRLSLLQKVIRECEHPSIIIHTAKSAKEEIDQTVELYRQQWEKARV